MKHFLSILFVIGLTFGFFSDADAKQLSFDVLRNGDKIGTHVFNISQKANETIVTVRTRLKVTAVFVTVFRYEHDRKEVWKDGKLITFTSKTHNDGDDLTLSVKNTGNAFMAIDQDGKQSSLANTALPVTLWYNKIVNGNQLFSALDAVIYSVSSRKVGNETIQIGSKRYQTTKYTMTGQLNRHLWYDQNGDLVKIQFDKDGSDIVYIRTR